MFYRGESTAYEHPCMPGLYRLSEDMSVLEEKDFYLRCLADVASISAFKRLSSDVIIEGSFTELKHLIALQHYGFPTRLIDITKSNEIALYFACSSNYGEEGYIYRFDKTKDIKTPEAKIIARKIKCIFDFEIVQNINILAYFKEIEGEIKSNTLSESIIMLSAT